ncbi:hypothetical protein SAMN05444380_11625 [Thermophagus xiamenensis]|jgi:hypothetical protein|uniref:Uncharacterized protein n=1 Tax=Thermophagus xiamenensis TaxID=385682 RepID=A0A1I2CI29_9BACT|nr:hypothetical protein SAMN05444380_11625 [Thermophagus xiamenensis]
MTAFKGQYINEVSKIYTDETSMTMRDFHKRECIKLFVMRVPSDQ